MIWVAFGVAAALAVAGLLYVLVKALGPVRNRYKPPERIEHDYHAQVMKDAHGHWNWRIVDSMNAPVEEPDDPLLNTSGWNNTKIDAQREAQRQMKRIWRHYNPEPWENVE